MTIFGPPYERKILAGRLTSLKEQKTLLVFILTHL